MSCGDGDNDDEEEEEYEEESCVDVFSRLRLFHDVDVYCCEEVLQRLNGGGQPVVLRGEIFLHHTLGDLSLVVGHKTFPI